MPLDEEQRLSLNRSKLRKILAEDSLQEFQVVRKKHLLLTFTKQLEKDNQQEMSLALNMNRIHA